MEISKSIVDKCGGLPKVIAAIGEACESERERYRTMCPWSNTGWNPSSWLESLSDNFICTLETDPKFHGLRPLFSWMQSYFDACSDSIKPCIFYLSIFSTQKNIRLRRLLWRWIAEGYCRDTSDGRTCEENWEKFISELVNLSIVQKLPGKPLCKINGFFHEYIITRPMEDNLVFALEEGCSLNSQRGGQHLTIRSTWDRRDRIVYESIDFSRLRSLTVIGEWKSFFVCSKKVNMRLLRVLDLEDATNLTNEDLEQIVKRLTRLKFLSLRGHTKITRLPISMGGLRQLQTMDIRGTSIVTLPLFITKLQKLQYIRAGTIAFEAWDWEEGAVILAEGEEDEAPSAAAREGDVVSAGGVEDGASSSAQAVTNLPRRPPASIPTEGGTHSTGRVLPADAAAGSSVSSNNWPRTPNLVSSLLSKLCRQGALDKTNGGVKVPAGIKKLAVLHTLGIVNVNVTCAKSIFEALKQLTQLHKLGVSGINKRNIKEFCVAISGHANLKSLSVEVHKGGGNLDGLDDIPQLPKTLNSLKLYGRVNQLLVLLARGLPVMEKLKIDMTISKPDEFPPNPYLPVITLCRCHLRIRPIQDVELHIGPYWRYVRVIEIQCRSVLYVNFVAEDHVRWGWSIEVLKVHFSGGSQSYLHISGLSNLWKLKEVWFKGYTDVHKQDMQRQINEMRLQWGQQRPVLKLVQTCLP